MPHIDDRALGPRRPDKLHRFHPLNPMHPSALHPGFIALHSNRSEDLAQAVINWIRRQPLRPLEEEVILVQSNGMAEWFKMEMAAIGGVCAATRVELPGRFLWRTYRQVLGREAVPSDSPLDKVPMIWRLMQLLPQLITEPDFAPVAGFLRADEPDRLLQLASKLADLFDQYQNYRADWLEAWALGQDHILLASGAASELAPDQRWQPQLWRAVLQTLDASQQQAIRPRLHQRVLAQLHSGAPLAGKVASRVIVFGMSALPWSTLQALEALGQHSQVMLAIPNPCRFYWGDIMEGRELLQSPRRRQPLRHGRDLADLPLEDMHAHAHPLLAAWGRQGRDFIRQLDVFDDAAQTRQQFELARLDLFDESDDDGQTPLLQQVQNRIRDLVPLSEHVPHHIAASDQSIVFHTGHSPVRELEILQDQLLQLLASGTGQTALKPRDVIVMVPDIELIAPAIRAVFGQYRRQDARYIPFDIADMSARASSPLIGALQWLLKLPQQRCRMSELVDLLEVPAVAGRFGIDQESQPKLTQWMVGAGMRWGLNAEHRSELGLLACGDQNSAWFGLRRMLLGYASGAASVDQPLAQVAEIEPYAEIGGLEAELAGSLAHLLQALVDWQTLASTPAPPAVWAARGRSLLAAMVKAELEPDRQALSALDEGLSSWQQACDAAGFAEELPLAVAREAWLEATETPRLNQRFRAGGVTFCTLMPMRAIPFEVVCLLDMNDGDYPRRSLRSDFDLMGLPGTARPGDRSRRDDDRQLMLEALLSARRVLYVSWCGHSVRDNSEQPPSVLVSQLRDYLSVGWGAQVVQTRTTAHPLQPFSRRYFEVGSPLFTHAREWRAAHASPTVASAAPLQATDQSRATDGLPLGERVLALSAFVPDPGVPLTLAQLTQFLRRPARAFFRHRLQVVFEDDGPENADEECFAVDALQEYGLIQDLLATASAAPDPAQVSATVARALSRLRRTGALPLQGVGDLQHQALQATLGTLLQAWQAAQARFPVAAERQSVRQQEGDVILQDWIDPLRQSEASGDPAQAGHPGVVTAWLTLEPGKLLDGSTKPKPRPDKLLGPWVRSLALAASGLRAQGLLVGRDGTVEISPVPAEAASATLRMLLALWRQGMNAPLPLPPKTALAWLANKDAVAQYEGSFMSTGEVDEPCLARMFPDFDALTEDGRFDDLAKQVYGELLAWVKQHVSAHFHANELAAADATD